MKVKEIIKFIENFAPLEFQEDFDNSGLQVGDVFMEVTGILLCLDVTEKVMDEAIHKKCNLIISHHPILFSSLKKLTGKTYIERCIIKSCKNNITIYSAHTNLDNALDGINFFLAQKIGLQNVTLLKPRKNDLLKLVVFAPVEHAEIIRNSLFHAGAGKIGNYDFCSFNSLGEGTFCGKSNTRPFIGGKEKFCKKKEIKIEMIFPAYKKNKLLDIIQNYHPYEEPVYDIFTTLNLSDISGSGVIGNLPIEENELFFLQKIKTIFNLKILKYSQLIGKSIFRVALCSGNGAFLIQDALIGGADIFITGEARYNNYYDVFGKMVLAVIGHHESEYYVKEFFFKKMSEKFTNFPIFASKTDINPINYI